MDKKLTRKDIWVQFFKHCGGSPLETSTIKLNLFNNSGEVYYQGEVLASLTKETIEMGMLRLIKARLDEKKLHAEQAQERAQISYATLMMELEMASDALASQGTSIDENYSNPENVEGG